MQVAVSDSIQVVDSNCGGLYMRVEDVGLGLIATTQTTLRAVDILGVTVLMHRDGNTVQLGRFAGFPHLLEHLKKEWEKWLDWHAPGTPEPGPAWLIYGGQLTIVTRELLKQFAAEYPNGQTLDQYLAFARSGEGW